MTIPDYAMGDVRIGDCLEMMPKFPGVESVDLLLTDPPYAIFSNIHNQAFGKNHDAWYARQWTDHLSWLSHAWETLKPGAWVICFEHPGDLFFLREAMLKVGLQFHGFGVWHQTTRFSNRWNYPMNLFDIWAYASKPGERYYKHNGFTDVFSEPGSRDDPTPNVIVRGQKPVPMLRKMIRTLCPEDGLVFDPFLGSGSTGRAAREEGRRWAGIEIGELNEPLIRAKALNTTRSLDSFAEAD